MEPTLHGDPRFLRGDRLGVNKLIYGPRVPFVNKRLLHFAEPKRWDIVVFRTVEENAVHKTLVKRVVGLPGERIHIADGTIWVNGQRVEPPEDLRSVLYYTTTLAEDEQNLQRFVLGMAKTNAQSPLLNPNNSTAQNYYADLARIRERLGKRDPADVPPEEARALLDELRVVSRGIAEQLYSAYLAARYPLRYGMLPDDEYALVPENCYLVCGDNSGESVDGRFFGWLPNDHILGRAFCIMWPPGRCRDLTGFSKTWWGKGLLLGLPALIIGIEIASVLRKRAHRAGNVAQPPSAV
jgi:signal peptidase I